MTAADVLRTGALGLRTRRARAALSALGIAIGVASMVAVLGISESSKADLLAELDQLGTNLLRVAPGQSFIGEEAVLPEASAPMLRRVAGVESVAATAAVAGQTVRRNPLRRRGRDRRDQRRRRRPGAARRGRRDAAARHVPERRHRRAIRRSCSAPRRRRRSGSTTPARACGSAGAGSRSSGSSTPVTLARRARQRGADRLRRRPRDCSATEGNPSTVYVRADPERVDGVRDLLGATANPQRPGGGRGLAAVRRARGARGGQDRVHVAVPRPRRGGAARRRRRDRQRDGDLGARAPLGDRAAARARRDPAQRRRAVPGRVAAARRRRAASPARCSGRWSRSATRLGGLDRRGAARSRWPAGVGRRGRSPAASAGALPGARAPRGLVPEPEALASARLVGGEEAPDRLVGVEAPRRPASRGRRRRGGGARPRGRGRSR